jgi:hypothetical protein
VAVPKALREELLKKLNVGWRRLNQMAAQLAIEGPMSREQAIQVIAHRNRIPLGQYLSREELDDLRRLVADLDRGNGSSRTKAPSSTKRPTTKIPTPVVVTIAGIKIGGIPTLKSSHAKEAKAMAERVYPTMYLFENSVRDFIEHVLSATHGASWWNLAVPKKVRDQADDVKEKEKKDTWHGKRGRRDIDYLFLPALWTIIRTRWKDFEPFFPQGQHWAQTLIESNMNVPRRVIAHMNPLEENDIKGLEADFRRWVKHLKTIENKLS